MTPGLQAILAALAGGGQGLVQDLAQRRQQGAQNFKDVLSLLNEQRQLKLADLQAQNVASEMATRADAQQRLAENDRRTLVTNAYTKQAPLQPGAPDAGIAPKLGSPVTDETAALFQSFGLPMVNGVVQAATTPDAQRTGMIQTEGPLRGLPGVKLQAPTDVLSQVRPASNTEQNTYNTNQLALNRAMEQNQLELRAKAALAKAAQAGGDLTKLSPDEKSDIVKYNPTMAPMVNPPEAPAQLKDVLGDNGKPTLGVWDPRHPTGMQTVSGQPIMHPSPVPPASVQIRMDQANMPPPPVLSTKPTPEQGMQIDKATGWTYNSIFTGGVEEALTGKAPSVGLSGQGQSQAIRIAARNTSAELMMRAGVDPGQLQADYKQFQATKNRLGGMYTAMEASANAAKANLDIALQKMKDVPLTFVPDVNKALNFIRSNATSAPGLSAYETAVYTAIREYAKVATGSAASTTGLTDSAVREAQQILNTWQTPEVFAANVGVMKQDMDNIIQQQNQTLAQFMPPTMKKFYSYINGQAAPAATPAAPATFDPRNFKLIGGQH